MKFSINKGKEADKPTKPVTKEVSFSVRGSGILKRELNKADKALQAEQKFMEQVPDTKAPRNRNILETIIARREFQNEVESKANNTENDIKALKLNRPASEQGDDWEFDDSQARAIDGLLAEQYACLIGAAGTGKSTTVDEIVERIRNTFKLIDLNKAQTSVAVGATPTMGIPIAFCSFMGTAVDNLRSKLKPEFRKQCQTIHATLGYAPEYYDDTDADGKYVSRMRFVPTFTRYNKLPFKAIFIDEGQTCPIDLWNELIDALLPDCRIYLIGDINQIATVMGRPALGFAMTQWPTFELTTIHRQKMADGSKKIHPIIAASQNILKGQNPVRETGVVDIALVPSDTGARKMQQIVYQMVTQMAKNGEFDPLRDAIVTPVNGNELGQETFNERFVTYFNPPKYADNNPKGMMLNPRTLIKAGRETLMLAVGDKLMLLQNDKDRGLTNGMIGVLTQISLNGNFKEDRGTTHADLNFELNEEDHLDLSLHDIAGGMEEFQKNEEEKEDNQRQASHTITIRFENDVVGGGKEVTFQTVGQYKKLRHAYAFTGHKTLGHQYHTVVIVVHSAAGRMLNREWLYTVFTRGIKRVVLICNMRGLTKSLTRQNIRGKTTEEKIRSFNAIWDNSKEDAILPVLPPRNRLG